MYHSEGYADKLTYHGQGHIWGMVMEQEGCPCYVWCLSSMQVGDYEKRAYDMDKWGYQKLVYDIEKWAYQELAYSLPKGAVYIQKELNRYNNCLKEKGFSTNIYVYYDKEVYMAQEESDINYDKCTECWGIHGRTGYLVSGNWAWPVLGEGVQTDMRDSYTADTPAIWGNRLTTALLGAVNKEAIQQGYFFVWEA